MLNLELNEPLQGYWVSDYFVGTQTYNIIDTKKIKFNYAYQDNYAESIFSKSAIFE